MAKLTASLDSRFGIHGLDLLEPLVRLAELSDQCGAGSAIDRIAEVANIRTRLLCDNYPDRRASDRIAVGFGIPAGSVRQPLAPVDRF